MRNVYQLPTLLKMDRPEDVDIVLQWGHRLKLYAELQGAYYERLRSCGLDEDHAFQLLREWTIRTIGWASSSVEMDMFGSAAIEPPPPGAAPPMPPGWGVLTALGDPSVAEPDEPYLMLDDDSMPDVDADAA